MTDKGTFLYSWDDRRLFTDQFVHGKRTKRFVFGCNLLGRRISEVVDIDGFIDDKFPGPEFFGRPVLKSNQIPTDAIVVSAIVGVSPVSVERLLHSSGVLHVDYFAFLKESDLDLMPVPFWGDAHNDMIDNWQEYESILQRMSDDESTRSFRDFMLFRKSMNLEYMLGYTNRQTEQYFEEFLELTRPGLNFFDLGCFDGFTSLEFSRLSPQYSSINAFEPVPRLYETCKANLQGLRDCSVHNFGAAAESRSDVFVDDGSSSTSSTSGTVKVKLERLDDVLLPSPNFIKIDIEGAEVNALRGMQQLISKARPMFAVATYHYPSEVRDLVRFWDALGLSGQVYFRHYTEGTTESVLFLCPG